MSGTTVHVGPFNVGRAPAPPDELPPIQRPSEVRFGESLSLLGSDRDRGDLRPGETLALSLYWLLEDKVEEAVEAHGRAPVQVALWLEGIAPPRAARRVPLWEGDPVQGRYPFTRWEPPEFVRDRYALRLPLDVQAGDYDLRLALPRSDGTPLFTAGGSEWMSLGTIHVHASDRLWEAPAFEHVVSARLGDVVELLGYDLERSGEALHLTLIWRCLRETEVSYTVFAHLLDEGGRIRDQQDNPPVGGSYPTTLWVPGEVVVDPYVLTVQPDALAGSYVIEVGLYDAATMQRLPVLDPTGAVGDRVLLGIGD